MADAAEQKKAQRERGESEQQPVMAQTAGGGEEEHVGATDANGKGQVLQEEGTLNNESSAEVGC